MRFFDHFHDAWHRRHGHHHHHHAIGRGHRGFAGFGGRHGFGDAMRGGMDDLQRGRKLGSADLQLLLLALLAEKPSHGYELIQLLEQRSKGYYQPSPGMAYPALTYLEEIGFASVEADGSKKLYSVTVAGLAHLDEHRAAVDALLAQLALIGERMEQVRQAMSSAEAAEGDDEESGGRRGFFGHGRRGAGWPELHAARKELKAAMVSKIGADAEELRRIAAILIEAAAKVRTGGKA